MIIDLILDRKDGIPYNAHRFYTMVLGYREVFPELSDPITLAMDYGTEQDTKNALKHYVISQGYNKNICKYIDSVNWI